MRLLKWLGFAALGISLLYFATYPARFNSTRWGVVNKWGSDHTSHFCAAAIFVRHPIDLYRKPTQEVCTPLPKEQAKKLAKEWGRGEDEFCDLPGRNLPADRPLFINWPSVPRAYPPGDYIYVAPEALLWAYTRLSQATIDVISVTKYIVVAHLTVLVAALLLLGTWRGRGGQGRTLSLGVGLPVVAWIYYQSVGWASRGFYDGLGVFFLFLAAWFSVRGRRVEAFAAAVAAPFCHFRALWLAPMIGVLGLDAIKHWVSYGLDRRQKVLAGVTTVMGVLTLITFGLLYPNIGKAWAAWANNMASPAKWSWDSGSHVSLGIVIAAVLLDSLLARNYLVAATIAWQLFTVVRTPQLWGWHSVHCLALFAVAQLAPQRGRATLAVAVLYLAELKLIFGDNPLPGDWIADIIKHNI